jgi:hypothetical protein
MSDFSFKQAKELVDGIELAELSIKKAVIDLEKSSQKLDESLKKQNFVLALLPKQNIKILILELVIALNLGFVFGIIFAKYFL